VSPAHLSLSPAVFSLVLTVGAFLLALWILLRYSNFGPRKVIWAVVHVGIAWVLLMLLLPAAFDAIAGSGIGGVPFLQVFGVALPMLVYAFLTGGWMTRAAMALLP
jgi:hypothetical protein